MPTVSIAGVPLFYEAYDQQVATANQRENNKQPNAQPPLLLIHGAGGTYLHWPSHLRRLPNRCVYALDLPGHGRSGGAALETIADYTQVITALIDHLALSRVVVAGHSMGGAIALDLALSTPDCVAGLVLMSTGARLRVNPAILQGLRDDFTATTAQLVDWMYAPTWPPAQRQRALQQLRTNTAQQLLADFRACDRFDRRADLAMIKQPTLISCGTLDQMTPVSYSTFLQQAIAGSTLHLLPECGHMAMIETPDQIIDLVGTFLAQVET